MRLGLLIFDTTGSTDAETEANLLAETLRGKDIDVVTNTPEPDALTGIQKPPETVPATAAIIDTFAHAQEAGARLHRADCDGVVFWIGENASPAFAAPAALFLSCPTLLCGANHASFYDAAGVLEMRGVVFDRLILTGEAAHTASFTETWLAQNNRKVRQKGTDAAQKLFGKRLILPNQNAAQTVDAAAFFDQFGVLVTSDSGEAPGENDLVTEAGGDACAALAEFLLRGVSEDGTDVRRVFAGVLADLPNEAEQTVCQIYQRKGRFVCLLAPADYAKTAPFRNAVCGSILFIAAGNVQAEMKAACAALDVDVKEI